MYTLSKKLHQKRDVKRNKCKYQWSCMWNALQKPTTMASVEWKSTNVCKAVSNGGNS